jgi:type 1 fimbria pilin
MSDSAKYKNSTRLIQLALMSGTLIASSAWGFETNYDRGRVDFAGRVTDISCSVALNGGNNAGRERLAGAGQPGRSTRSRGGGIYETTAFHAGTQTASFAMMAARWIKMKFGW